MGWHDGPPCRPTYPKRRQARFQPRVATYALSRLKTIDQGRCSHLAIGVTRSAAAVLAASPAGSRHRPAEVATYRPSGEKATISIPGKVCTSPASPFSRIGQSRAMAPDESLLCGRSVAASQRPPVATAGRTCPAIEGMVTVVTSRKGFVDQSSRSWRLLSSKVHVHHTPCAVVGDGLNQL